jgi:hypothetical protein
MAALLDQTIAQRFDLLKAEIKAFRDRLSGTSDESIEAVREDIHGIQNTLENEYTSLIAEAGGQAAVNANENLHQRRVQTRNALVTMRMILQARWDYDYSDEDLERDANIENENSNRNTVMGGEETRRRRRRSRKQLGGRRRLRRRTHRKRRTIK